jgi:tetratricopeptide (TPR) repeat protein
MRFILTIILTIILTLAGSFFLKEFLFLKTAWAQNSGLLPKKQENPLSKNVNKKNIDTRMPVEAKNLVGTRKPAETKKPIDTRMPSSEKVVKKAKSSSSRKRRSPLTLGQVQSLISEKRLSEASVALSKLQRDPNLDKAQIKYLLGLTLLDQGYHQLAAIQFVDVIRQKSPKYIKQALDKLSVAADELGDETLLNYALKRIDEKDFPMSRMDTLYYRKGENAALSGNVPEALKNYAKVRSGNRYFFVSQYQMLVHYLELKQIDQALSIAHRLLNRAETQNDKEIVILALARSFYQKQDWESAIKFYKMIPRDSLYWGDSLFELSWAQLRSARFRSVIGTLQTLHSPFYEDEYMPESLIVRGIVYLYICKFDELDKTVKLFETLYGQYARKMNHFYRAHKNDTKAIVRELGRADEFRRTGQSQNEGFVPYPVMRSILKEGDIQKTLRYQGKIKKELQKIESDPVLGKGPFVSYSRKVLNKRLANSQTALTGYVKIHLRSRIAEWKDLEDQVSLLKYELINGKKELVKQKIAGKNLAGSEIDGDKSRDFYVDAGYEYWPVESEVWLDELGNYHYLGRQECR